MPLPSRSETANEVTYTLYAENDNEPSYLIVHKTVPLSYTVRPSSVAAQGKTFQSMIDELDVSLGFVTAPV